MSHVYPGIFGPPVWQTLHMAAMIADESGETEKTRAFIEALVEVLWCSVCQDNFKRHIRESPVPEKDLFKWTVDIHNVVNRYNGVSELSFDEAYRNTRALLTAQSKAINHDVDRLRDYAEIRRLKGLLGADIEYLDVTSEGYLARIANGVRSADRSWVIDDVVDARISGSYMAVLGSDHTVSVFKGEKKVYENVDVSAIAMHKGALYMVKKSGVFSYELKKKKEKFIALPDCIGVSRDGGLAFTASEVYAPENDTYTLLSEQLVDDEEDEITCVSGVPSEFVVGTVGGRVIHVIERKFIMTNRVRTPQFVVDVALYHEDPEHYGRVVYTDGITIGGAFSERGYTRALFINKDNEIFLEPNRLGKPLNPEEEEPAEFSESDEEDPEEDSEKDSEEESAEDPEDDEVTEA